MQIPRLAIAKSLAALTQIPESEILSSLTRPPKPELGDIAFPTFRLAQQLRQPPEKAARELLAKLKLPEGIEKAEYVGGYINFFLSRGELIKKAITLAINRNWEMGRKGERVMVEFSQPNTHKEFHIGHLRNAVLGDALVRMLRFCGEEVIAANYIGDVGTHVAKSLWYIQKFCKKLPDKNQGEWLASQYPKAVQLVESHPEYKADVDKVHQMLDAGDKFWISLWKKTRAWSLAEFRKIYKELGIKFDIYFYESEVAEAGKSIALKLLEQGIARRDQGSLLVDLQKHGLGVFLVLKSDGTPLYSTKDLELARRKFSEYDISRSIYVVGSEQELYFKQLFKTLELMGFPQAKNCSHLSYGLVQLKSGKMSSRLGNVVSYHSFRDAVFREAVRQVKKRHRGWTTEKINATAFKITLAAIKFTMISKELRRVIEFDINQSLSFEGESGPYLQYVYTRCRAILRKAKLKRSGDFDSGLLKAEEEFLLARQISLFPEVVCDSAESLKPHQLPRYLLDLAQLFNNYYQKHRVVQPDTELMRARLSLVKAVASVMKEGLELLGIPTLEEM